MKRQKNKGLYFFLMCLFIVLLSSGCAYTKVTFNVPRPAAIDMTPYATVGTWALKGKNGNVLSDELNQALVGSGRFKVVNQDKLESILGQQKKQSSDVFDPQYSAKIGEVLGASAVISGKVKKHDFDESVTQKTSTESRLDSENKSYDVTVITKTRTVVAAVNVVLEVTDVTTAQTLVSKILTKSKTKTSSAKADAPGNPTPPAIDGNSMLATCREEIVSEFMKQIAPWTDPVTTVLFQGDGTFEIMGVDEFDQGIDYMKIKQLREAEGIFKRAINTVTNSEDKDPELIARAWYNYAVALHYQWKFKEAIKAYDKAIGMQADGRFSAGKQNCIQDEKDAKINKERERRREERDI